MVTQTREAPPCRLCGGETAGLFGAQVLGRIPITYWKCLRCDLVQTDEPTWLEEAYGEALSHLDTGAIERNLLLSATTAALCRILGIGPQEHCLDFGGGHGVFARMMRDRGYDFRWFDLHAANHYARGFEGDPGGRYTLVTAFELFEHLADPSGTLDRLFGAGPGAVLAGTLLHQGPPPHWWYLMPATGQHVSFYSDATMRHIGDRYGYRAICEPGGRCTLFVDRGRPLGALRRAWARRVLRGSGWATRLARPGAYPTRSQSDHALLSRRAGDGGA